MAMNWNQALSTRWNLIREAKKVPLPIDAQATEDRNAVAAAVRGAVSHVPAEPPPNFATMSDKEFRDWKRANFR
jgi:hypothetical protein